MIIKKEELLTFKEDFDISTIKDVSFYISKVKAVLAGEWEHQNDMRKDAKVILKALKEYYPQYFI